MISTIFKSIITVLAALTVSLGGNAATTEQIDLGKLGQALSGDGAGSAISAVIGSVLSTDKVKLSQMTGTWHYNAPAVSFKSENILKKAGGAAAAQKVADKLAPVYKMAGADKMEITINADSTFTITRGSIKLSGTISAVTDSKSQANYVFNFNKSAKFKAVSLEVFVVRGVSDLELMFDVSKLLDVVKRVGNLSGQSGMLGSVTSLLASYDGMTAGFELKK